MSKNDGSMHWDLHLLICILERNIATMTANFSLFHSFPVDMTSKWGGIGRLNQLLLGTWQLHALFLYS